MILSVRYVIRGQHEYPYGRLYRQSCTTLHPPYPHPLSCYHVTTARNQIFITDELYQNSITPLPQPPPPTTTNHRHTPYWSTGKIKILSTPDKHVRRRRPGKDYVKYIRKCACPRGIIYIDIVPKYKSHGCTTCNNIYICYYMMGLVHF